MGPGLSDDDLARYARQIVLPDIGGVGQRRLKAARVAVIGAGGIGSAVIPALAGAGVGAMTIIDDDVVDLANLHRQTMFATADIGSPKARKAADYVAALNPGVEVEAVDSRIDRDNAAAMLAGHDLVIDGSDSFATRLAVSDGCIAQGVALVSAAAVMFQAQVGLFTGKPCYRCWVGDAFDAEDCDTCAEQGVVGALTGTAGNFAALIAIQHIVGMAPSVGQIHVFDGRGLRWKTIRVPVDPLCPACSGRD